MGSGSFRQVEVRCPYYRADDGDRSIECESLTPGGRLHTRYQRKADYEAQMRDFCCNRYWDCHICDAIDHKYATMEEEG